jgi:acyl-coenzyme A thioesterase PaaI-like protein
MKSLQELYAPGSACFGCGPANEKGLHVRSYPSGEGDEVVGEWRPEPQYEAFPGVLNGGIVGALLDCHSNWAAAYHFMRRAGAERTPGTVTAEFSVKLLRPTPTDTTLHLSARVTESTDARAVVEATLTAGGKVCATCRGIFIAVRPGHPAYHRWREGEGKAEG